MYVTIIFIQFYFFIYLDYQLNNIDASIQDCFEVLSIDSKYIIG
jgi:hypothetical protein